MDGSIGHLAVFMATMIFCVVLFQIFIIPLIAVAFKRIAFPLMDKVIAWDLEKFYNRCFDRVIAAWKNFFKKPSAGPTE